MPKGESLTSPRRILAKEKAWQVFELRKAGVQWHDIAVRLGYAGDSGAKMAYKRLVANVKAPEVQELRLLQDARLDDMLISQYPQARKGNQGAVDRVLKIEAQRAALWGLNAPAKVEHSGAVEVDIREVIAEIPADLVSNDAGD